MRWAHNCDRLEQLHGAAFLKSKGIGALLSVLVVFVVNSVSSHQSFLDFSDSWSPVR
jgi:hypothetical protein